MKYITLSAVVAVLATTAPSIVAFSTRPFGTTSSYRRSALNMSTENVAAPVGFIESELRGAAMKLHTRKQAPKEGQAEEDSSTTEEQQPYITTHDDYLQFLVDSLHVYQAMEEIVNDKDELVVFRNTGLERTKPLQEDIEFMVKTYGLKRPEVGPAGREYADELRRIAARGAIPEFICHYYNFYFAHTAGGRMIGKQMSALLLDKKTLEFYKWDGDLNEIKKRVKDDIEAMAAQWSREEKDECVDATAAAFRGGGMINSYLSVGRRAN